MAFNSLWFPPFFLFFLLGTLFTRGRLRLWWFCLMSYLFYAFAGPAFVILLFASSLVDWQVGRRLHRESRVRRRRLWLAVSLVVNLGILSVFKYAGFVSSQLNPVFAWLGIPLRLNYVDVPLPPGVSFYTFQTLSYTIDIYRGEIEPADSALEFFCFVAFFPQLVAGPIVRAREFLPQLKTYRPLRRHDTMVGLEFVLVGLFKKMVIADHLAFWVEQGFNPRVMSPANLLLASALFAVQIYCDFSGYTDVARGLARILGFQLPQNFRWPYFSHNLREFWRRWHMTLSFWLRDYLYFSLGGSRVSPWRRRFNLFVTWFLCGLWHGAAWKFVAWGLFHGLFAEISRFTPIAKRKLWRGLQVVVTFGVVCLSWMLFRAQDVEQGLTIMAKGLGLHNLGAWLKLSPHFLPLNHLGLEGYVAGFPYCGWLVLAMVALAAGVHALTMRLDYSLEGRKFLSRLPWTAFMLSCGVVIFLILILKAPQEPFIYFTF